MAVLLTILKWLGIILLIILGLVLLILLLVLLVPIHYSASAQITDPEPHESFPFSQIRKNAQVGAEATWFLKILRILAAYPASEKITVYIFGKKLDISRFLHKDEEKEEEEKGEEEQEKEEEAEKSASDQVEEIIDRADNALVKADTYWRILTGTCGRRAMEKVMNRLLHILRHILPQNWELNGILGFGDPYRSGKIAQITSVLYPVTEEHMRIDTDWEYYRADLHLNMQGRIRLGTFVTQLLPLLFDKDCRKVYKKFRKVRAKLG